MLSWTLFLQPYITWTSEKHVKSMCLCARCPRGTSALLKPVLRPEGPSHPSPLLTLPLLPTVSPRPAGAQWKGPVKQPIHSAGRDGTPDLPPVIPVPHSSWNLNANLIAAATESSVIKRIKKHLYCDFASCQKSILKQKMKTAFMFNLQKFILNIASVTLCLKCGIARFTLSPVTYFFINYIWEEKKFLKREGAVEKARPRF